MWVLVDATDSKIAVQEASLPYNTITQADRGENQREKSNVSLLPVSPYYTTLGCTRTHYLVCTDPMLHGPLTDSGCTYAGFFTSVVTPEVKVERSSDLRAEQSSEMGAEQSSDSKSRAGRSSNLGVGWNLEQQKCEMGCPLTMDSDSVVDRVIWGCFLDTHMTIQP